MLSIALWSDKWSMVLSRVERSNRTCIRRHFQKYRSLSSQSTWSNRTPPSTTATCCPPITKQKQLDWLSELSLNSKCCRRAELTLKNRAESRDKCKNKSLGC